MYVICLGMSKQGKEIERQIASHTTTRMAVCGGYTLGAPGHSSWERCVAGIPTLQIVFSESQRAVGKAIEQANAGITVWNVLDEGPIDMVALERRIKACLDPTLLRSMGEHARRLCDGKGVERTIKLLEEGCARTMEDTLCK